MGFELSASDKVDKSESFEGRTNIFVVKNRITSPLSFLKKPCPFISVRTI